MIEKDAMDEEQFVDDEDYEDYVAPRKGRDIDFLIVLRLEFRGGMHDDLVPGGMQKLTRLHKKYVSQWITYPLEDYASLPIDDRMERLQEAGKRMVRAIVPDDTVVPPISLVV